MFSLQIANRFNLPCYKGGGKVSISVWFMVYKLLVMYVTGGYKAPTIITAVCELCVYVSLRVSISDEMFTLTDLLHWPSLFYF